jgi:hypothetical protein
VNSFLKNHNNPSIDKNVLNQAKEFAERDDEWLLYPCDPMPDGLGVSARLSLNKDLDLLDWLKDI